MKKYEILAVIGSEDDVDYDYYYEDAYSEGEALESFLAKKIQHRYIVRLVEVGA